MTIATLIENLQEDISWLGYNETERKIIEHIKCAITLLELLKEQKAVEPRRVDGKRNHFIKCGNCNYDLLTGYMFCPHCGKAVK